MWFRPRSQPNDTERSRVSSIRNRMRSKKSISKLDADGKDVTTKPITVTPNRYRRDSGDVLRSQSGRRLSLISDNDDDVTGTKEKNKVLRTDQKYKKNRVTKSSSRTKMPDLKIEKQSSGKMLNSNNSSGSTGAGQRKLSTPLIDPTSPVKAKARRNTSLNLNALLRYKSFISGSTKKLTSDDFDRLRRKSLGDTNKVRRKSNPDSDKKPVEKDVEESSKKNHNHHQQSPTFETDDKFSDDDFQSCSEDQVDHSTGFFSILNKPDKGCDSLSTTSKKTKTKNKKKGFYLRIY